MYRNILVAIDGSVTAGRALEQATGLAQALRAHLTVLTVVPPLPGTVYRAGIDVGALQRQAEKEAKDLLQEAADGMPDDVSVTTRLLEGHPAEEILRQIEDGDHDLVVLGSRGRGRLVTSLLGSTGATLHFHMHVPLLVVHPGDEESSEH